MSLTAIPYVLLLSFVFGSTLIASRFSIGQYHPTNYIGLRLLLASLGHVAFYLFSRRQTWPTDRRVWQYAIPLGVFGTAIPMISIVSSLQYLSSGLTAVMITAGPAFTVIMAHFFLPDETLTVRKSFGVVLALSGAVFLSILGESGLQDMRAANPISYGLIFLGMIVGSSATIYIRKFMREMDHFDVASIRMFAAALTILPLSAIFIGFDLSQVNKQGYFALGYASLMGTFSGLLLVIYITQRFGATTNAMAAYGIPIVAATGGALVLGEQITPGMLVGMALIAVGIGIINRRGKDQAETV